MSVIGSNILAGASGQAGYNLTNSLRFRSSASAYLNRTPASATNRRTWTWSAWVKRSELSSNQSLFAVNATGDYQEFRFTASNTLQLILDAAANNYAVEVPTVVWRDVSAWYHIVLAVDTTQATSTNRVKIYVNGIQQTVSAVSGFSFPAQNFDTYVNATLPHAIGNFNYLNSAYFNGYMTEINFIDGQALTPSSFGETSSTTGVWIPKKYSGTYGTNGFYLPFTDNSALTTSSNVGLGKDFSGNANYWTTNNISITSGATYDSMTDVPTLTSATTANYAVMNPLQGTGITGSFYLDSANLNLNVTNNSGYRNFGATFSPEGFKGYLEVTMATSPNTQIGFAYESITPSNLQYTSAGTFYVGNNGDVSNGSTVIKSGCIPSLSSSDILQIAFDFTGGARNVWFGLNGTWGSNSVGVGVPSTGTNPVLTVSNIAQASRFYFAVNTGGGTVTIATNFGQRPFSYTPPTGFVALNTFNLPTPTIGATASSQANKYFNAITYTGNGAASSNTTQNITTTFYPDLTWVKGRDSSFFHRLTSTGLTQPNYLSTNSTDAEGSVNDTISALASTYFQVKAAGTGGTNQSGSTYVGWTWNANSGSTVSNTAGSITSTVSANTSAGFSVVTYTGTGSNATVGHGLGVAPSMVIVKQRNTSQSWCVWHTSIGSANVLFLNSTSASTSYSTLFNSMSTLNSTVFSIGTDIGTNQNTGTYVAYCFAPIAGYSAFGSYTGNGSSDGTFVFTGFRPAFVLTKRSDTSGNWYLWDNKRIISANGDAGLLYPDSSLAESDYNAAGIDLLSNGFKLRNTDSSDNASGGTYIYMAFAENPFKYANAR